MAVELRTVQYFTPPCWSVAAWLRRGKSLSRR